MSLPVLDVSLNFSSGATFGNPFTLDDPVNGLLGTGFLSDSSVSRELIIGGVALISIILTAYTAQDRNMAKGKWEEHLLSFQMSPKFSKRIARVSRVNGSEKIYMRNGSTYGIVTPNDKGARGLSLNLMVIDEALTHPLSLIANLQPTLATKRNGQLWILSNAGRPGESELLEHYREIGHREIAEPQNKLAWFEWCPATDDFDYMDQEVWYQAIPSLHEEKGVLLDAVKEAATTNSPEIFTKEWLNLVNPEFEYL